MVTLASMRQWLPITSTLRSPHYADRAGANGRFIADLDLFAENCAWADGYVPADLRGGGNDGGGMNDSRFGGRDRGAASRLGRRLRRGWVEIRIGLEARRWRRSLRQLWRQRTSGARRRDAGRSSTKTRLSLVADCRLETLVTVMEPSPMRRQPSFSARSRKVCFMVVYCRFPERVCTTRMLSCLPSTLSP